ncbi:neuropilin and tolloid-like isoform X2 [Leptinotarsa decemlineata]|uniref:neuropilin and tolloid-like isoform X2 n=1 Tax=Leptinotarsa decemlineata TaxID=7539 RepID=UPI003D306540
MISLKWSGQFFWLNALVSMMITIPSVQSSAGDRYRRKASDSVPQLSKEPVQEACKPFVNVTNNQFFSPGYPADNYTNNTDCVLVLEAPPGYLIKLDFRDWFQIEQSVECKNDFLEVRDGAHGFSTLLHSPFCGINTFPPMMTSSDRHLWIHFKSDENIEYKGFKAVYEFIRRPESLTTPEVIPCYMNHTLKEEGEFGKNDIDKDTIDIYTTHNMPIDCLWSVTVKPKWRVYLQFAEFNLEKPNDCASNFVQVFSGKTDMTACDKEFCGSIADTVLSKGNKMFVRFFSESKSNKTLFKANFTAFRDLGSDKNQKCAEDEYYCEDATCIHESLKCNGNFNCRYRWDEEDDDCQNSQSNTWSGDHIIIIMVIFSLILTGMCMTFVYNCVTKIIKDHRTIQEYIRQSREQQLNELEKQEPSEKQAPSKMGSRSRSHSTQSTDSNRFDAINAVTNTTPCYVPGGDVLPILIRHDHSMSPSNGDAYNTNIYTVDNESPPQMCDSACQTRESLFTTQGYSSGNTTPSHSIHTNSPPAPFSTFGYKKETKFKAEAKIEMTPNNYVAKHQQQNRRPYSVQTTKSAPDVIVTH